MAVDTPASFEKLVIYEVFVRNHGPNGTFADVAADLPRIKALGVDVVWLMAIHPVGEINRKGSQGSPYAIADYRAINPNFGSETDFKALIDTAHQLGLKVMLDVVYNHTSPDSVLAKQHPEWFYCEEIGEPAPRFAEWSDVVDLNYHDPALFEYQIDNLLKWVKMGVDGFRCDVAPLVPVEFWQQARQAVAKLKPNFIWLAESVHLHFVRFMRSQGYLAHSDSELYQAFDICYDYDIHNEWAACVRGDLSLTDYVKMLELQDGIYPANYIKLRFVENHDQPRAAALFPDTNQLKNWTAFAAFNKGAFLIYAGQETGTDKLPSLFEIEPIVWSTGTPPLSDFLARLTALKKDHATDGTFDILARDTHIQAQWRYQSSLYGIFNLRGIIGSVPVKLPDGDYTNLLNGTSITVAGEHVNIPPEPVIVRVNG